MTKDKSRKRTVRERMAKTGESYTSARRNVLNAPRPDERDDVSDVECTIAIKVRPFVDYLEREPDLPALEIRGTIEDRCFLVWVLGQRVELKTIEVGEDKHGSYAFIGECTRELADGFKLHADIDPDEDGMHGGVLDIYLEGRPLEGVEQALREQGIDPASVNLLTPKERSFSLYFDHWGKVNGRGATYVHRRPTERITC